MTRSLLIALLLAIGLTACGKKEEAAVAPVAVPAVVEAAKDAGATAAAGVASAAAGAASTGAGAVTDAAKGAADTAADAAKQAADAAAAATKK